MAQTILWVVGVVVLLLAAGGGFIAWIVIAHWRKDRRVREEGRPVLTALVMANKGLQDPDGLPQEPGTVVFGFYEPSPKLRAVLQKIAERVYGLYETEDVDSLSPACREFALTIKADAYTEDRRYRVPPEIAGSLTVFAADLWINRDRLPKDWETSRMLACAVTGNEAGEIVHLPADDPAAQKLYAAGGG